VPLIRKGSLPVQVAEENQGKLANLTYLSSCGQQSSQQTWWQCDS